VDMVMTKFGLSILTMKILEFWGWSQSNFDWLFWQWHFEFGQMIINCGHRTPPPPNYCVVYFKILSNFSLMNEVASSQLINIRTILNQNIKSNMSSKLLLQNTI
jgi:hypothetical protein